MRKEGKKKFCMKASHYSYVETVLESSMMSHYHERFYDALHLLKNLSSCLMNEWTIPKALRDDDKDEEWTFKSDDIWILLLIQDIP